MKNKDSASISPLSTAAQYILLALADRDLHGYGIVQEIPELSEGSYRLGPGTLYDTLKKLMDAGFVVDAPRQPKAGDDRRFYRITGEGRKVLSAEIARLKNLVSAHQRLNKPRNA
jgi:DNA-binding PadR family transcriptional regulator